MKRYFLGWFALLLFLLMVGCESDTDSTTTNSEVSQNETLAIPEFDSVNTDQVWGYNCDDSLQFTAHVTPDSAWLFLSDTTVKVLPTRSASGARYEGEKYLYWSKGKEAILQKPVGSFMQCQTIPREKAWAAAKLRGVNFRALGQEPGWVIELTQDAQTRYVGNYGKDTLLFNTPDPQESETGDVIYQMKTDNNTLHLTVSDTLCTDIMSGFEHPKTVTITINDMTRYTGCGRYLN